MIAFPDLPRARSCATTLTTRAGLDLAGGGSLEVDLARTIGEPPGAPLHLTLTHVPPSGACDLLTLALTPAEVYGLLGLLDAAFTRALTDRVLLPPAAAAAAADLQAAAPGTPEGHAAEQASTPRTPDSPGDG